MDIHTDQWNRKEKPEIDPHKYAQLILAKNQCNSQRKEREPFQQMIQKQLDIHRQSIDLKPIRHWWKKLKITQIERYTMYYVLRLKESIMLKWLYYPKTSTNLMQPLIHYQWHFFKQNQSKNTFNLNGNVKDPE